MQMDMIFYHYVFIFGIFMFDQKHDILYVFNYKRNFIKIQTQNPNYSTIFSVLVTAEE